MTQAAKCGHSSRYPSGEESGGLVTEKGQLPSRDRIVSMLGLGGGTEPGLPDQHQLPPPPCTVCLPTASGQEGAWCVSIAAELHTAGGLRAHGAEVARGRGAALTPLPGLPSAMLCLCLAFHSELE